MTATSEELPDGGTVIYDDSFLDQREASSLRDQVLSELDWEQRAILLFGREVQQPRLIAWGGDAEYRYSGRTLETRPLTPAVKNLLPRVSGASEVAFNHVLVNRYRNEQDSMGFHADDEPELGDDPIVATLSLGETRRFVFLPRRKGSRKITYEPTSGSLLVMRGPCQARYRHGIPKEATVRRERISLTFRRVLFPPHGKG